MLVEGDASGEDVFGVLGRSTGVLPTAIDFVALPFVLGLSNDSREIDVFASTIAGAGESVELRLLKNDKIPPDFFSDRLGRVLSFSSVSGSFQPAGVSSFSMYF